MDEILKSKLLESKKSAILLDLMKHDSGKKYLKLTQTIGKHKENSILINPEILNSLMHFLEIFQKEIDSDINPSVEGKEEKIVSAYLKGVPAKELAMRFECEVEEVEMILRNKGIAIYERRPPFFRRRKK